MILKFLSRNMCCLLFITTLNPIWAQDSENEVRRQIARVQNEINTEQSAIQQQRDLNQQRTQLNQQRMQNGQNQLIQLRTNNEVLRQQIELQKNQNQSLRNTASSYDSRRTALSRQLVQVVDQLSAATAKGFPMQRNERLQRLKELREQLANAQLSPEEGMNRLWTFVLERNRQSREAETWPGSYVDNNNSIPGQYVRLGTVFQAFASQDNSRMFYLNLEKGQWVWHDVGNDKEIKTALTEAFAVAQAKQPPKYVRIPVRLQKEVEK